jgi:PPK2 family polyphosphate:nucleotide phosphotransferase
VEKRPKQLMLTPLARVVISLTEVHEMKRYRIQPAQKVHFEKWDPNDTSAFVGKKNDALKNVQTLTKKLDELQELLYAEYKHKMLIVLQAVDTGGKDGTIRRIFEGVNPQGVRVAKFGVPTQEELDHDYLWRVHSQVPSKGEIVIFNRSHYEDVLVVRVHDLIPEESWQRRYQQINDFERLLCEEGTTILKFYLHIDADEQKRRLQARLDDPKLQWKFKINDLKERMLWREYMKAYEDVLEKTSTHWAPWYLVPANHKWYRDWVVSNVIVEELEKLDMKYPRLAQDPKSIVIK